MHLSPLPKCFAHNSPDCDRFKNSARVFKSAYLISPNLGDLEPSNFAYQHYTLTGTLKTLLNYSNVRENNCLSTGDPEVDVTVQIRLRQLYISMPKERYHSMGIPGRKLNKKNASERFIAVYKMSENFVPGKAEFDRLMWALDNTFTESIQLVIASQEKLDDLEKLVEEESPVEVNVKVIHPTVTTLHNIMTPDFSVSAQALDTNDLEYLEDVYNWAAMTIIDSPLIHANHGLDLSLANYHLVEPSNETTDTVYIVRFPGPIPVHPLSQMYCHLDNITTHWAILLSLGNENAIVLDKGQFHASGDYNACILARPDHSISTLNLVSGYDI